MVLQTILCTKVAFFVVSPMSFVVQVHGFVVSCHLVEVNLVQGAPVDAFQVFLRQYLFY